MKLPAKAKRKKSAVAAKGKKRVVASATPKTLYDLFKPFVGAIKDGPRDLARNHKLYASGIKKWK